MLAAQIDDDFTMTIDTRSSSNGGEDATSNTLVAGRSPLGAGA